MFTNKSPIEHATKNQRRYDFEFRSQFRRRLIKMMTLKQSKRATSHFGQIYIEITSQRRHGFRQDCIEMFHQNDVPAAKNCDVTST